MTRKRTLATSLPSLPSGCSLLLAVVPVLLGACGQIEGAAQGLEEKAGAALIEARERTGMGVIDVDDAPRQVLRSLRAGRVVAMLADQNAHRGGVFVPFFGKLASTARGPAVFALRTGAPMFLGIPLRNRGWKQEYTVELRRIDFQPSGHIDADVLALTAVHTEALEQAIGEAPEQYFWQHKRWKKRPEGEST